MTKPDILAPENLEPVMVNDDAGARAAWAELIGVMQRGQEIVYSTDMGLDTVDRGEGMRFLTQAMRLAMELYLDRGDPGRPAFGTWMSAYQKVLGDNPDARYDSAAVSSKHRYELFGEVHPDCVAMTFTVYGRGPNGWNQPRAETIPEDLNLKDGKFSIILSKDRPEGDADWMELPDDAHMVLVRQFFLNTAQEDRPQPFDIRRIDEGPAYEVYGEAKFAEAMRDANYFYEIAVNATLALARMRSDPSNSFDPPSSFDPGIVGIYYPSVYNAYAGGWFKLEDDEALILEGEPQPGAYWIVHIMNRWMQSIMGPDKNQRLNNGDIQVDADGKWRVIVSARDPGHANWLNTCGHREGHLTMRIVHPTPQGVIRPVAKLVKAGEVAAVLAQAGTTIVGTNTGSVDQASIL